MSATGIDPQSAAKAVAPPAPRSVSVVIPSWNTRDLLAVCLDHVFNLERPPAEVIVIDNASADGSADMVAERFPAVRLQRNARNEGFAIGCNQGIRLANEPYILLLNADTEMAQDALEVLVRFLDANPEYGAAAPRLVHPGGGTQRACQAFPNLLTPLFFATPFERWFPNSPELVRYFERGFDHEHERDINQPPAACFLVRRSALDAVGLFDESLWLFFNDVDLSRRLVAAGWRTRFLPQTVVAHHVGASTRQFGSFVPEWHKNRLAYYRKHHGRGAGMWVKLCVLFAWLDFCVQQLAKRIRGRPAEPLGPITRHLVRYLGS